jgi:hypothetical protein
MPLPGNGNRRDADSKPKPCSSGRGVAAARRLAMVTWKEILGRPAIHMARTLGIAASSGSELTLSALPEDRDPADRIARALLRSPIA